MEGEPGVSSLRVTLATREAEFESQVKALGIPFNVPQVSLPASNPLAQFG